MKKTLLLLVAIAFTTTIFSQKILSEKIDYFDVRLPNQSLESSISKYTVLVEIPYTLTVEDINAQSLADFETEKSNYVLVLSKSETEYDELLANHEEEVENAEARYDKEMKDFKALSMVERMILTDQGKTPKLRVPSKPTYIKPREPEYRKPNLNDFLLFDKDVLEDGVLLYGYDKGEQELLIVINISKMLFEDNGGQTFYSQPTNMKLMKGSQIIDDHNFDSEFKYLTSSSSNSINLDRYEKENVNKIMKNVTSYLNEEFGYIPLASTIAVEYPKNKKREYDALENAKNKAISAYRKLNKNASSETRERSKKELLESRTIWISELKKVDYSDKKALFNKDVAKAIFFNLIKVDISLKDKNQAEETLKTIQEKRIDLDFNYNEEAMFTRLEEQVYKM